MRYQRTQIGHLTMCVLFIAAIFVAVTGIVAPGARDSFLILALIEVILHFRDRIQQTDNQD